MRELTDIELNEVSGGWVVPPYVTVGNGTLADIVLGSSIFGGVGGIPLPGGGGINAGGDGSVIVAE